MTWLQNASIDELEASYSNGLLASENTAETQRAICDSRSTGTNTMVLLGRNVEPARRVSRTAWRHLARDSLLLLNNMLQYLPRRGEQLYPGGGDGGRPQRKVGIANWGGGNKTVQE